MRHTTRSLLGLPLEQLGAQGIRRRHEQAVRLLDRALLELTEPTPAQRLRGAVEEVSMSLKELARFDSSQATCEMPPEFLPRYSRCVGLLEGEALEPGGASSKGLGLREVRTILAEMLGFWHRLEHSR